MAAAPDRTTRTASTVGPSGSRTRTSPASDAAAAKRRALTPAGLRGQLLDAGISLVCEKGWENLGLGDVAGCAGVSLGSVRQRFAGVEALALAVAHRFEDEVYDTAVAAIGHHPNDLRSAMRHCLERFFEDLREQRLAYVALVTGAWRPPPLKAPLRQVRIRKRRRLVEIWARYYERVNGLGQRDAVRLSSFQYDGLRGLIAQVDGGTLASEAAITLFLEVLASAVERLGGEIDTRLRIRSRPTSSRRSSVMVTRIKEQGDELEAAWAKKPR